MIQDNSGQLKISSFPLTYSGSQDSMSSPLFLNPHSHISNTRQPDSSNCFLTSASRSLLEESLADQNSGLVRGVVAYRQPVCLCQKQPWTKMQSLYFGRTISGLPGRFVTCNLYRNPWENRTSRTISSGRVFFPLIPAIILERVVESTTSTGSLPA